MSDVSQIQSWIREVVGENVDWEVNPETVKILTSLKEKHEQYEQHNKVLLEEEKRRESEYIGEYTRLKEILGRIGITDQMLSGPAGTYIEVLSDCCALLDEESCGVGLELAVGKLLADQAETQPQLGVLRQQIDKMQSETVSLYSQVERVEAGLQQAETEGKQEVAAAANQSKKLEFMRAKEKQYRASLEKEERSLVKAGGGDTSLRHPKVADLGAQLSHLQEEIAPRQKQMGGYLSLPASCDLAQVELAKADQELKELNQLVASQISALHV